MMYLSSRLLSRDDGPDVVSVGSAGLVAVAVAFVALSQLLPAGPVRAIVAIPVMLLVPGWLAWSALFGRWRPDDPVVVTAIAVTLGMAVLILNGLVVNALGVRLSEFSLVVGPALVSVALLGIVRLRGGDATVRVRIAGASRFAAPAIVLVCSVALVVVAVTYAAGRLPAAASPPFTEVSFPASLAQSPAPIRVVAGQVVKLTVQVRLHGRDRAAYQIETWVDGALQSTKPYEITAPVWATTVNVTAPAGRCLHQVRIVFAPRQTGLETESLDKYLAGAGGPVCAR